MLNLGFAKRLRDFKLRRIFKNKKKLHCRGEKDCNWTDFRTLHSKGHIHKIIMLDIRGHFGDGAADFNIRSNKLANSSRNQPQFEQTSLYSLSIRPKSLSKEAIQNEVCESKEIWR